MDRRNFIRFTACSAGAAIISPKLLIASPVSTMAGGLYYTKDAPGRWCKKAAGHLPNIEIDKKTGSTTVHVSTLHEMKGYEHYIIKHILLDKDFKFVTEKMFDPIKDKRPVSEFVMADYTGKIHVLSVCNKHDTWLNIAEI